MKPSYLFQTWGARVLCPAREKLSASLLHIRIGDVCGTTQTKTFQQRLIGKGPLESGSGVLDETIQKYKSTDLAVGVPVLELLPNCTGCFRRARRLQLNDLDKLNDAAQVVLFIALRGEVFDCDGNGRVWLLLLAKLAYVHPEMGAARGALTGGLLDCTEMKVYLRKHDDGDASRFFTL